MYRIVLIAVFVVALTTGCKKKPKETVPDSAPPAPYVSSGGGVVAGNQQGNLSGGGGIQGTRTAPARTVNNAQLRELHLSLSQSFLLDNRLPSPQEIMQEAQRNPQLHPLLKEEVIILTGATRGDQVWAYTQYPQRGGEHSVITQQGVEPMNPEDLRKRLEAQGAPIKMSK